MLWVCLVLKHLLLFLNHEICFSEKLNLACKLINLLKKWHNVALKFITEGSDTSQAPYSYYGQGRIFYAIERS